MGALGKFEVVLGYVVEYVNSPFCQGIVGNYFVSSKSECDRESADPAFERSKAVERLERLERLERGRFRTGPFGCCILSPDCSASKRGRLLYSFFVRLTSDSTGLAHRCCAAGLRAGATTTRAAPPYPRSSLPLFTVVGNKKNVLGIASRAKFYS